MEHAPRHPPPALPDARRILVRGVNWLGDAVMTTPALLRLRERFPRAHVALLTAEKIAELWRHHPAINETIPFAPGEGVFSVSRKIRAGNFDLALVLPNSPRSALETWLAGVRFRVGYARPWRNFFLTHRVASRDAVKMRKRSLAEIRRLTGADSQSPIANRQSDIHNPQSPMPDPQSAIGNRQSAMDDSHSSHQLHDFLHLVAALGADPAPLPPRLVVTAEELEAARKKFGLTEIQGPLFGLNPGAEYGPAKRWPVERFIEAARAIQQHTNCTWLILGGESDRGLANEIQSAIGSRPSAIQDLAGRTSLRELCALLKLCRVLLTNDTGPMHVAAALDTPVVVPFGSTSPELTGPGLPGDGRHRLLKSNAPCSPCFLRECPIDFRCMHGIAVERVVTAVVEAAAGRS
jgi:lipopolysaccharide heptosyltransferase II